MSRAHRRTSAQGRAGSSVAANLDDLAVSHVTAERGGCDHDPVAHCCFHPCSLCLSLHPDRWVRSRLDHCIHSVGNPGDGRRGQKRSATNVRQHPCCVEPARGGRWTGRSSMRLPWGSNSATASPPTGARYGRRVSNQAAAGSPDVGSRRSCRRRYGSDQGNDNLYPVVVSHYLVGFLTAASSERVWPGHATTVPQRDGLR